jgi:hypothetical protein
VAPKVATAYVTVEAEGGRMVTLRPGDVVPADVEDKLTNPAAFAEVGKPSQAAPEVVTDDPEADLPLADRKFASLQAAAKNRGLSGAGKAEALIARIEAHDRESAK